MSETDSGDVVEYDMEDTVEKAILENIHREGKRFYQAEEAPTICKGRLRGVTLDTMLIMQLLPGQCSMALTNSRKIIIRRRAKYSSK